MQKWNHRCECKELDIAAPVKMIICRILARVIVNAIKHIKLMNISILKNVCVKNVQSIN